MRVNFKRCLIGLQKGVSKSSKGHLLQAKRALIGSQLTPFYSPAFEFYLQDRMTEENRRRQNDKKTKEKGRRKIIFYIFPFGLYSFLSPPLSTPHYVYIYRDILVSVPPPCMGGGWENLVG